jgi:hypothetical protein
MASAPRSLPRVNTKLFHELSAKCGAILASIWISREAANNSSEINGPSFEHAGGGELGGQHAPGEAPPGLTGNAG